MDLDIIYELQSIDINQREKVTVQLKGIVINYENNNYIISIHQGLPIKKIIIKDKEYLKYIYCAWNDLIIIPIDETISDTFVFKHFVKKQMDFNNNYTINNHSSKFIKTVFAPIKMIPENPSVMYNIFKCNETVLPGQAIVDNNKLCGIACKFENNNTFAIPINYIIKSLTKKDNKNIYTINHDLTSISKINNNKIVCSKIYCQYHKAYIPPDCFISFYGDEDYIFNIQINNTIRRINSEIFKNTIIDNSDYFIIKENTIRLNSGLLHYLKIIGEQALIKLIFNDSKDIKFNNYIII
jgi:hypothetical protein